MEDILKVDYDFYVEKYKGSQAEAEIADALDRAAINIFTVTYCRTKTSKLTPFQTDMAKMAICAEAENGFSYWIAGMYQGGDVPDGLELYSFPEDKQKQV